MHEDLTAPCGLNCAVCSQYLALEHDAKSQGIRIPYCPGCRPRNKNCAFLKKTCDLLRKGIIKYCHECPGFPCERLNRLDERYTKRFRTSPIENLRFIKEHGIRRFLQMEEERWRCRACGGVISCHNGVCFTCGLETLKHRRNLLRWDV